MPYLPVLELLIEMKGLFYTFSVIFTCAVCFLALIVTLFNTYLFIRSVFIGIVIILNVMAGFYFVVKDGVFQ